jgi:hypothetical protein
MSRGNRRASGRRIGDVEGDWVDPVPILGNQIGELLRSACGGGYQVPGLKCRADKRAAEAARGARDEPDLLHETQ